MPETEHLSHDEFFTSLSSLFKTTHTKNHGSVHLTQKRLLYGNSSIPEGAKVSDNPLWDLNPPNPLPILVRASNGASQEARKEGHKVKISTVVQPDDIEGFFARYAEVCKKGMEGLKKRDRSKKKKKVKGRKEGE